MGKRRVGGNSRVLRKKKLKFSKKGSTSNVSTGSASIHTVKKIPQLRLRKPGIRASSEKQRLAALEALRKQRSQLLKQQAAECMVLKEHTRELETRRQRMRKGENAKTERRELGKYIRQLKEEQKKKHRAELLAIEEAVKKHGGKKGPSVKHDADEWEDIEEDMDEFGADELQSMFSHLTT